MAANPQQFPEEDQRLVIRPDNSTVVTFSVVMGVIGLIGAGALLMLGSPVAALLGLGILGLITYAALSQYLWVDATRVGVSRFPWGASCQRDQLARLQIVFVGRSRRTCAFVRKDGHTAFRVPADAFGSQLQPLARSLGVPYYDLFSSNRPDFPTLS